MNGIFVPQEILKDERLNSNEKFVLSYYWYHTRKQNDHCCKKENGDVMDELKISMRTLTRAKKHLKELGLIRCNGGVKVWFVGNKDGQNDLLDGQNDLLDGQNDLLDGQNDLLDGQNDQNDLLDGQNDTHNKEIKNKKNKEKNKENKENKATDESLDDFLSSWEEDALKGKQEYQQAKKDNSCDVVDMVMGLPYKEETTPKEEPTIKEQYIDKSSIIQRMISLIDHWIVTEIVNNNKRTPSEKERLLKENTYNRNQLEKFFGEYILNKDLNKMNDNEQYFTNITENAFRTYKIRIKSEAKKVSQKNPYSDLEENNTYKETDRWKK